MDRASVLEELRNMHVGWAWRRPELELPTLELSTKLLEYAACGIPPIVAPGPVNLELLGADYPLFAAGDALADLLRSIVLDPGTLEGARAGLAGTADRYAYAAVRSRHVAPMIGEIAADAAGSRWSGQGADA